MDLRSSAVVALCMLGLALTAGCKSTPEPAQQPPPTQVAEPEESPPTQNPCELCPDICKARCSACPDTEGCMKAGGFCSVEQSQIHYLDTDGGNKPFKEGCLDFYTDSICQVARTSHGPDFCCQGTLFEHVAPACTPKPGFEAIDCAKLCQAEVGSPSGRCVDTPNPCNFLPPPKPPFGGPFNGGKCVCN